MTPAIHRMLTVSPYLDQLLTVEYSAWAVLMDAVEETGRPAETWLEVADLMTETPWAPQNRIDAQRAAFQMMFHGIATVSYQYAVHLLQRYEGGVDVRDLRSAVEGMNAARCGKNWENDLGRDQVEWVLGQQGNLEKEMLVFREVAEMPGGHGGQIVIGDRSFTPVHVNVDHRRHLWMTFPPEYLEKELQREHGWDAEFMTIISEGGGYDQGAPALMLIPNKDGDEIWEHVSGTNHSGETECPLKDWDEETRDDVRGRTVSIEDTYCGDHPGRNCRYCEEPLGNKHGYLFVGEGTEEVYVRLVDGEEDDE